MNRSILAWTAVILLLIIHTADMLLTEQYVGNDPCRETFPPMQWAIRNFGIYPALWISRVITYLYCWVTLMNHEKKGWNSFLVLITILYWTAMIPWLFSLGIAEWPHDWSHVSHYIQHQFSPNR